MRDWSVGVFLVSSSTLPISVWNNAMKEKRYYTLKTISKTMINCSQNRFLKTMNCSVTVQICNNGEEIFHAHKTADDLRNAGYKQQQLQTDEEPLEPLKENDIFYLAAAVEVIL